MSAYVVSKTTVVVSDYYGAEAGAKPYYVAMLHSPDTDTSVNAHRLLAQLLVEAGAPTTMTAPSSSWTWPRQRTRPGGTGAEATGPGRSPSQSRRKLVKPLVLALPSTSGPGVSPRVWS